MAEILGILIGPVIELGKYIVAPIQRQFNYLCCFKANVRSLQKEAKKLEYEREGLQMQVDAAKNNGRVILPAVETWLKDATDIRNKMTEIEETDIPNAQRGCLAVKSRYLLGKKAKKTAEEMKELRNDGKFDPISQPAPPAATLSVAHEETHEFQSRLQIEEDIMQALQDKQFNKIGICGMGGVGKTTMAKKITDTMRKQNLFDEAVLVVVSQQADMSKIQRQIAQSLGLKFEEESLQDRARRLCQRLTGPKRILIVLDDIWEELKLVDLGIPGESGFEGRCKTLLTSRDSKLLKRMDAQAFALDTLPKSEALSLFKDKAGTCVDSPNLKSIAEEVVEECSGLPVAIVTVGRALKDEPKPAWENALQLLKTANPRSIPEFLKRVYNPLLLSYKSLDDQHAKSLFLLGCLFPEDFDISLEDLTMYGMGLGLFERVDTLEQARNRVFTIVDLLKSRFLLLESEEDHHVKMHDVIRDVAIFIASEERLADVQHRSSDVDWKWISVFSETNDEFPDYLTGGSNFPNLCFLAIRGPLDIKDFSFLERMKQLSVLSLYEISFKSLPETIQSLKNLRTLRFEGCEMESISTVGQLLSLETLCCYSCDEIKELPVEIAKLKRLRLLDISDCRRLSRIAPGIISKLVKLEELKMRRSFKGWESANVKQEERRNASLKELESLSKLRHLEIEIEDVNLVAEELRLSSNIEKYFIDVGDSAWRIDPEFDKRIGLKLPIERINLGGWIYEFVRSTEMLYLEGLPNLEEICEGPIPYRSNSFNNLKELRLEGLPALKHLWKSPNQHVSLCNLRKIKIRSCGSLHNLFLLGTAEDGLPQLESLKIEECDEMEVVFPNEENEEGRKKSHVSLPKLRKLKLTNLPSLQTFCRGEIESIEFPLLEVMKISYCPKLRSMVSPVESNQNWPNHNDDDQSLHFFCNEKVKIGGLTHLMLQGYDDISNIWCQKVSLRFFEKLEQFEIYECNHILKLFSYSIAENFVNLVTLRIGSCDEMENVITHEDDHLQLKSPHMQRCEMMEEVSLNEKNEMNENCSHVTFPKLKELELGVMRSLATFSDGIESMDFPVLNSMIIQNCPELVSIVSPVDWNQNLADDHDIESLHLFCSPKVKFGGLKKLKMEGYNDICKLWCQLIPLHFFKIVEKLEISDCYSMKSLFSSLTYENFVNLKDLSIENCDQMEKVIAHMKEVDEKSILFPELGWLRLYNLPLLGMFCEWTCVVELPLLSQVVIKACPQMQFLTPGSLGTPETWYRSIDNEHFWEKEINERGGLNGVVRQHMSTRMKKPSDGKSTSTEDEQEERERKEESSKEKEKDKEIC